MLLSRDYVGFYRKYYAEGLRRLGSPKFPLTEVRPARF
jgi:hypothetical protein